jgi:signal transduction histidine kinase/CheY-like chemotaxis protein/HPt (histidine-containing phosphotransfer) domain-containing protein
VRPRQSNPSIRRQLLALFGLLLLAGAAVLVIDEIAQYRARQSLQSLRDDSLGRLRALKAVADGYSMGVVDTTFKVRNYLIDWPQGVAALDRAHAAIDRNWRDLERMPRAPEQARLFVQTGQARLRADRALLELRAILVRRDVHALGVFADNRLYPAIDPVSTRLQKLSDLAMVEAQGVVRADVVRGYRASALRIGLSLLALLVAALAGRRILRNAYRGVESLTRLAQRMREHDYVAAPDERPRGELGEVMDAFLDMRGDVLRFETELTDQLVRNERVRAELELRERFLRVMVDAAPIAIMGVDDRGRYTLFNKAAEHLLGQPADAFIGKRASSPLEHGDECAPFLVEPGEYERLAAGLGERVGRKVAPDWRAFRLAAELGLPAGEAEMLHRDGHRVPVWLALGLTYDANDAPYGVLGMAMDLTPLKQLEARLRASESRAIEANHAKSAFLAAMSHEIRTPMIGVTGMVEILAHTSLDADQRRALNVIQSSAQSLLQIIGDILDFSKIEAGRLELQPVATSLSRVVHSAVANFSGSASSKGLTLTCTVDERVPPAHYADALRLRQILSNFLSNAIKFTDAGVVQAVLEWRGGDPRGNPEQGRDLLCFRVTDTGIGVSSQAQARLFQPFAQAEGDTTRRFGGTGLGLAICRRLAELMGGEVGMESVPGLGTTMRLMVTLPRAPASEVAPEPASTAVAAGFEPRSLPTVDAAERERSLVLLVDDHPTNRMVIARQLALAGYASEAAEDGEEGLQKWRSGRYAMLLSDVHMPRMDGYELARTIRAEEARDGRARTPIVALTASALKGEAERCLAAGMDDYLAKPVGIPALTAVLRRWMPHTIPAPADADAPPIAALPQLAHPPALDPATLDALTGGSDAVARELLDDFLASTVHDLAELDHAREAGDLPALTRQAHKIKGAARMVGAVELAETAGQLEASGRGEEWPAILPLAADLSTAAERLRRYVDERYPR